MNWIMLSGKLSYKPTLQRTPTEIPFCRATFEIQTNQYTSHPLVIEAYGELAQALSALNNGDDLVISGKVLEVDPLRISVKGIMREKDLVGTIEPSFTGSRS